MAPMSTLTPITIRGIRIYGSNPIKGYLALTNKTASKFLKEKKDFILLKKMTEPEDVSLIREAAAVCTLEGGPGCHAAIVCSTMGVPCITNLAQLKFKGKNSLICQRTLIEEGSFVSIKDSNVTLEGHHA